MNKLSLNNCLGVNRPSKLWFATAPPYSPNVVDQTVDFGGATWKGQPGGGWTMQRENPQATNYSALPGKSDINPETGKAYAINPDSGLFDDNYWSNIAEPKLKGQYGDSASGGVAGASTITQPTIDLPKLYESLFKSSGITDIEKSLVEKGTAHNNAVSGIKDNPYLSEATMTGRISKLDQKFSADSNTLKDDIAMKKADIETKLNLQAKQFDINSQQARQAFDQFQSLLSSGALDNISGQDIANLTRSTGLSSSMIQSAIGVSKTKNAPKVNTQVVEYDDGTDQGYMVINSDTGAVINKQVVAGSKPSAAEDKAAAGGGTGSGGATTLKGAKEQNLANLAQSVKNKVTLGTLLNAYRGILTVKEIYEIYNRYSPWGKAKESLKDLEKRYG